MTPKQTLLCMTSALLLAGCGSLSPNLDEQFGRTVTMLKAQQTLDPEASSRVVDPPPMDARAGREAVNGYNTSFRTPERGQGAFTMGLGR